jgi:hypothetical protein
MLTLAAGPAGVFQPGSAHDVSDELGAALIASGAAVSLEPIPVVSIELAALTPVLETADLPRARRPRAPRSSTS